MNGDQLSKFQIQLKKKKRDNYNLTENLVINPKAKLSMQISMSCL